MKYIFIFNLILLAMITSCGLYVGKFSYYEFLPVTLNFKNESIEIIVSPLMPNEKENNTRGNMVGGDYRIAVYSNDKIIVSKMTFFDYEDNSESYIFDDFKELNSFNGPYQHTYGFISFKKYKAVINFEVCSMSGCNSHTKEFSLVPVKTKRRELLL